MQLRALWASLVLALLPAVVVSADEITFKNGDRLTGKITSLVDGKMYVTTPEAGVLTIDASQVRSFATDAPIDLRLSDGTFMNRKVNLADDGVQLSGGLLGEHRVGVGDIDAINPAKTQWLGEIKFGGMLSRGNTSSETINLGIDLTRKTVQDVLSFDAGYQYGRTKNRATGAQTATADNWQTELKYEYNFTKRLYGFADVLASRDRLAFLDLRFNPAIGVGYRWLMKPDFTFATEGGIAWVYENYTNNTPTRRDFSLKLAYHLTKKFNDHVALFHNLSYFPSVEHGSNFIVNTDAGLRATLTKHFFTEFKVVLDYDSKPANGALKTNTRYQLNAGYSL